VGVRRECILDLNRTLFVILMVWTSHHPGRKRERENQKCVRARVRVRARVQDKGYYKPKMIADDTQAVVGGRNT
jgi:hypothetical protein